MQSDQLPLYIKLQQDTWIWDRFVAWRTGLCPAGYIKSFIAVTCNCARLLPEINCSIYLYAIFFQLARLCNICNFVRFQHSITSSFIHLPMSALVSFLHFGPVLGTNLLLQNSTKLLLKIGGGEADVCPPGVTMCVHPVSLARRTWIGRTSAGPILIL